MKAICINDYEWTTQKKSADGCISFKQTGPGYLDEVELISIFDFEGDRYYVLKDWSQNSIHGFDANEFILLSDIDEAEFKRHYQFRKIK